MSERFPWEKEAGASDEQTSLLDTPPEPAVQPDGDPRRTGETTPPAEVGTEADEGGDSDEDDATSPAEDVPHETPAPRPHGDPLRPAARERPVARKEYYSIGEVSDLVGLPAHVLRYWETQFPVLNPSKNRSGNRAYQRKEIKLILLVKHLLYEEKYTVEGAKAKLDQLRKGGALQEHTARALDVQTAHQLREELAQLHDLLKTN